MKLLASVNAQVAALQLLEERGWTLWRCSGESPEFWVATRDGKDIRADDPLQLLGLLSLADATGVQWPTREVALDVYRRRFSGAAPVLSHPDDSETVVMWDQPTLRTLVYGLGRGSGIRLTPRRTPREERAAALQLARDVLAAEKAPPDEELRAFVLDKLDALHALVDSDATSQDLGAALHAYILARFRGYYGVSET